ncbi:MAG: 5-(carboxyamino)imidazole ribonucleotide synthase [Geminicoccaceae bacterium]|nr:5-(carboxyamino)imidazole ribonucleotide synthase [Geminicoccaceae bacterium]
MTLAPGGTIGILGGGQLGRMTALAAARLGYRCRVLAPEADAPAADVAPYVRAAYDDGAALERFAAAVDVVTLEFENVPVAALERLAARVPVRPGASVLAVTQDRLREKAFVNAQGVATAPWAPVTGGADIEAARRRIPGAAVLKTARLGYDGRGQARLAAGEPLGPAWEGLGGGDCIIEGLVRFQGEVSVIVARNAAGDAVAYPPVANRHEDGILRETSVPSGLDAAQAEAAVAIALRLAGALDVVGLLAVEMFLDEDGTPLVNELAPRPHNSGHWSLDAAPVSQFEQLVRAVAGLPFGDPAPFAAARMVNLLGDEAGGWQGILADPTARLHLYGKREARPGRKMGHVTYVGQAGG